MNRLPDDAAGKGRGTRMKLWKMLSLLSIISLASLAALTGCTSKEKLHLYSWADNFDEQVLKDFEKQYNVSIKYDVFSNNEELLAKIKTSGANYDVIQPSDYMVATMAKLGLLEELNKANIPNIANVSKQFLNPPYDPGNKYSVIYTWGATGIAYNTKYVKDPINSWKNLWDPKYKGKVVLLDDSREVLGMGLKKLGYSNSTKDTKQVSAAMNDLKTLLPNVLAFDTDNIKQKFISEEAWIGTVWTGDAYLMAEDNKNIAFVIPKEGGTIWADNYAIPKGSKHKELAEKFINYMLDPQVDVTNYESIGYSDPNEKALSLHDPEFRNNKMIFPPDEDLKRTEWIMDVGEALQEYDKDWTELKSGRK
jgi:spermidine/putrescine transport system substrate-binding protein